MEHDELGDLERADQAVLKRSECLIEEFEVHFCTVVQEFPSLAERKSEVFEGWAIQKIAGLQESVEYLGRMIRDLEARLAEDLPSHGNN